MAGGAGCGAEGGESGEVAAAGGAGAERWEESGELAAAGGAGRGAVVERVEIPKISEGTLIFMILRAARRKIVRGRGHFYDFVCR